MRTAWRVLRAMVRGPQGVSQLAERREWREIAVLAARLAEVEAELAAQRAQTDDLAGGMVRVFGATGRPVPERMAADAPTEPIRLRRVV